MWGDASDLNPPRGQFHDKEDIIGYQAMPGCDLHREEVRGGQGFPVQREELRPAHTCLPALRRGFHVVTARDIAYVARLDGRPRVRARRLDAAVAPRAASLS